MSNLTLFVTICFIGEILLWLFVIIPTMLGALLSICDYPQNVGGPHAMHHLIWNGRKIWDLRWDKIYKKVSALNLYY
jgi:hypothetical protein